MAISEARVFFLVDKKSNFFVTLTLCKSLHYLDITARVEDGKSGGQLLALPHLQLLLAVAVALPVQVVKVVIHPGSPRPPATPPPRRLLTVARLLSLHAQTTKYLHT
jgi:hypothetical protein